MARPEHVGAEQDCVARFGKGVDGLAARHAPLHENFAPYDVFLQKFRGLVEVGVACEKNERAAADFLAKLFADARKVVGVEPSRSRAPNVGASVAMNARMWAL